MKQPQILPEEELTLQIRKNYEAFFNTLDDFLFVLDMEGQILHCNTTVFRRLNYTEEQIIGANVLDIHPVDRREEALKIVMEMVAGSTRKCPIPLLTADGFLVPVETSVIRGVWDNQPALFGVSKDISRLQFSEEKFAKSFYFNPTPCGFSDLETGNYLELNDAICDLLEFTQEEMLGKTAVELGILTPEEHSRLAALADEKGKLLNVPTYIYTRSGKKLSVQLSAENMYVADKKYRFTVVNDVSAINSAIALNEQYSRLQALMIKISSTYINIELEGVEEIIHYSLREMAEFVDADRAYIFEYDFDKNVCSNTFEWCREGITAEIDKLQNVPLDFIPNWIAVHRNGEAFYMPDINLLPNSGPYSVRGILEPQGVKSLITLPMKLNDDLVGFVGFDSVFDFHVYSEKERDLLVIFSEMLVNITERKLQSEALISAKNVAEEASRTKEIFLATMSHEIRTPLHVIIGMVREMMKQELSPTQHTLMANAKSAAVHLLSILNNILDLSKIESGEFVLEKVTFDINMLLADVQSIMSLKAKEKNLSLDMLIEPSIPSMFYGDEGRLRQIIVNLMDNAIKFTEKGSVSVEVWSEADSDSRHRIHVKVVDTGIGISPEFLTNIFSEFSQENNETSRQYQGVGLGMSIVKNLVGLMDGNIDLKSSKGVGTEFHFYVYMEVAQTGSVPAKQELKNSWGDFSGNRILLVEDNEMNRYVARMTLDALKCTVLEAENGEKAIEILKKEKFDLIIMDIQMPVMDGVEATLAIRKQLKLQTPILALTANAYRQNIEKYIESGMNGYIVKPYLEQEFLEKVRSFFTTQQVPDTSLNEMPLYDIGKLRELSKNDDQFMQDMIHIFIRVVNDAIPRYEECLRQGDFEGIRKLAHKLKPSIDHLAISTVTGVVRRVETADQNTMGWEAMVLLSDELFTVLKKVSLQLSDYNKHSN